ncbi:MAG: nuclear transport factor 2 family protein [Acidobacteriota bacterium]|nr:nuclear transport factor 2 family protein [Acidobacteriota bacterium]
MMKLLSIPKYFAAVTGLLIAASCLALGQTTDQQQARQNGVTEQEVLQLDRELIEARRKATKGDATALDRILADDFIATSLRGRVANKAQYIKYSTRPNLSFHNFNTEEVKARVYGDAAVITGRTTVKGRYQDEEFDTQFRYTRLYVKRGGLWQIVTSHLTSVSKP